MYHLFGDRVHKVQDSVEVQVHVVVERGDVAGKEHSRFANGCAAHDHVDLAVPLFDLIDDALHLAEA